GKHFRRHRLGISAAIAVLVALVIATGMVFWRMDRAAEDNRRLLARQYVARGVSILDEGDPLGSLPWLGAALKLDREDPVQEEMDRMRLGAALGNSPRLLRIWFHQAGARKAEFSRDGTRVATSSYDASARVWDVATGEAITPPLKHREQVNIASFSPNGSLVVTASHDCTAR